MVDIKHTEKSLLKKGFVKHEKSTHVHFHFTRKGSKRIFTYRSRGTKVISKSIEAAMANQLELNVKQFRDLVKCTLSEDGYVKILQSKNIL